MESESVQAVSGRRRRESTVADIVDATKRLLSAGTPVANLSVERIVAEAGVARATFYLHFHDKHALIARLAADEVAWREQIGAEILTDPHLRRADLDAIMRDITARWAAERPTLSAIIELAEYDPVVREIWRSAINQVAEKAAAQFRIRWAGSPSSPPDPDTIAEIFTWMFERCCHQLVIDGDNAERVAIGMAEVIWRVLDYRVRAGLAGAESGTVEPS